MAVLLDHWVLDPFAIVFAVLAAWHEAGLARLRRADRGQARARRLRSLLFYCGLAVALIAVASPVEYWAERYFYVHMIQHLLLMFAAPTLIVTGAPWTPLRAAWPAAPAATALPPGEPDGPVFAGPVSAGPGAGGTVSAAVPPGEPGGPVSAGPGAARRGPVRAAARFAGRPWTAVVAFNLTMIFWHLPGPLDASVTSPAVRIWLMHGSFLIVAVAFWLQFLSSPPLRLRLTPLAQAVALLATNVAMWVLAMAMGILTSASWYPVYDHVRGVTLPAFADQQIGAGILWICGDFWAIPCMILVVRRLIAADGSVSAAVDRMLGRGSRRYQWANRA